MKTLAIGFGTSGGGLHRPKENFRIVQSPAEADIWIDSIKDNTRRAGA